MVRVSAVVPVYNGARFLAEAIDSALRQEEIEVEVVVVDDGSTDDTPAVIRSYGSRIVALRQRNRGLAAARNAGIARSSGEQIAFLDADDAWEPAKSRRQLAYLDAHPACGLVFCDAYRMDAAGLRGEPILGAGARAIPTGRCLERLFLGNFVLVPGVMVRRAALAAAGAFDESLPAVEDYDMWLRLAAVVEVGIVPEPLACYREWPGQMSRDRDKLVACEARVLRLALARAPELHRALGGGRVRRRFARLFDEAGYRDLQERSPGRAARRFLQAARHDPAWGKPWLHLVAAALGAARLWAPPPRPDPAR